MTPSDPARRRALGASLLAVLQAPAFAAPDAPEPAPSGAGRHDASHDFDFIAGTWRARHRRLKERLANSSEWIEFGGTSVARLLLDGRANMDDNVFDIPGGAYRGVSLRAFDPKTGLWAIWWLDERFPHTIDAPVVGGFENGVGTFTCPDTLRGMPITVRYLLTPLSSTARRWEQAFSPDGGRTWETNWITLFTRST